MSTHSTNKDRTNHNQLDPLLLSTIYSSSNLISDLKLPRKYTINAHSTNTTSDDNSAHGPLVLCISHKYNKSLISNNNSHIVGKWVKSSNEYELHLKIILNHKNKEFINRHCCEYLNVVLQAIAFAETPLLLVHPKFVNANIYVHFESNDSEYDRVEYWHRLLYWTSDHRIETSRPVKQDHDDEHGNRYKPKEKSHIEDSISDDESEEKSHTDKSEEKKHRDNNEKKKKKKKRRNDRRSPLMCAQCQK